MALVPASHGLIEIDYYQKIYLKEEISARLNQLLDYWSSDNSQIIYDEFADSYSKYQVKRLEFTNRMLKKKWLPNKDTTQLDSENVKFIGLSRAFVVVNLEFYNKRNPNKKFSRAVTLNLTYEDVDLKRTWFFDLLPLLRASF
ncbi:MAG: hypothetical protein JJV97_02205 [SAR324 cluster bacterium]|nr:hypothetical protein [SAR324 cluster bacterium]